MFLKDLMADSLSIHDFNVPGTDAVTDLTVAVA